MNDIFTNQNHPSLLVSHVPISTTKRGNKKFDSVYNDVEMTRNNHVVKRSKMMENSAYCTKALAEMRSRLKAIAIIMVD